MTGADTRRTVEALYGAYFTGDPEGMLATMADEVEVTFLGRGTYRGIAATRRFLAANTGMLHDLDFRIRRFVVHGEWAAVVWDETARTRNGARYENHGVDLFRVQEGLVTVLHENNDVTVHRAAMGRQGPGRLGGGS